MASQTGTMRGMAEMSCRPPTLILTEDQIDEMVSIFSDSILATMDALKQAIETARSRYAAANPRSQAADIEALMRYVQSQVKQKHGVWLEPEVRIIGEFE